MQYLSFELSEGDDGVVTLEAMASTQAEQHGMVMAEVADVLRWAHTAFAHTQGPADDAMDWDHDLQVQHEPGGWHTVILTLAGSARFVRAFLEAFGEAE